MRGSAVLIYLGLAIFVLVNLVAVILIPLGIPGTILQCLAAAALAVLSDGTWLPWTWVGLFGVLALVAEAADWLAGRWGTQRFGGSRAAAWGALLGGFIGAIVGGIPVPVLGSILMSFVGTFLGALVGEMYGQRQLAPRLRVGAGAVVGRVIAVAVKLCIAFGILTMSVTVVALQLFHSR